MDKKVKKRSGQSKIDTNFTILSHEIN